MKIRINPLEVNITMTSLSLELLKHYLHTQGRKIHEDPGFSINTGDTTTEGISHILIVTISCINNDVHKFIESQQHLMSIIDKVNKATSNAIKSFE